MKCTRRLEADAGHRVTRHESKCQHVHGHRYAFEVTFEADALDDGGRVVDFGVVKERVGAWLDANLDHAYVHAPWDEVGAYLRGLGMRTHAMPDDLGEPTAENLAELVGRIALDLLADARLRVVSVRCHETPNCWADWMAGLS